jgi:glycosyltransferase involved in cell wall biosynthesis
MLRRTPLPTTSSRHVGRHGVRLGLVQKMVAPLVAGRTGRGCLGLLLVLVALLVVRALLLAVGGRWGRWTPRSGGECPSPALPEGLPPFSLATLRAPSPRVVVGGGPPIALAQGGSPPSPSSSSSSSSLPPAIPNIIHFVFGLKEGGDATFSFFNYAAVASALHVQRPEMVLLHYHTEPQGVFWDLVKPYVQLRRIRLFDSIFGNPITHYAHKADVVRLEALLEFGGIYLDIDVITLRPFDPLLLTSGADMVMGQEGENGRIGLCNAVIIASKSSPFLRRWYDLYRTFDQSQWNYHSVVLPGEMAKRYPDEIAVLGSRAFFWPLWDDAGQRLMFSSNEYDYADNYAVHIWNSKHTGYLSGFSMGWGAECRSTLLSHLALYVPKPLVSVIMPCFNQKQYILESIESVLAQRFRSWELLIVDDVSPDKCGDVVEAWFEAQYGGFPEDARPLIRVIRNERNVGLAESRNNAIRQARGHLICALDADDKISPDYFYEAQAALSADPNLGLIYSDQQFFGQSSWYWDVPEWDPVAPLARGPLPVMTVYRRSLWEAVGGYSSSLPRGNEDYDFWLKLVEVGVRGKKLGPGAHTFYRYKEKSMMRDGMALRGEELSMMHMRHPQLYHPAALLADHAVVGGMAEETYEVLMHRLERGVFHNDEDEISTHLWLAVRMVRLGRLVAAGKVLKAVRSAVGAAAVLTHRRVAWQAEYVAAQLSCTLGDYDLGQRALAALEESIPSLRGVRAFERQKLLCSPVTERFVPPAPPATHRGGGGGGRRGRKGGARDEEDDALQATEEGGTQEGRGGAEGGGGTEEDGELIAPALLPPAPRAAGRGAGEGRTRVW